MTTLEDVTNKRPELPSSNASAADFQFGAPAELNTPLEAAIGEE